MRRKGPRRGFAKCQRQAMKQLLCAVPDIFVRAHAEVGPELIFKSLSDEAVDTVRGHQQIAICLERIDIRNFVPEFNNHTEFFTAALQDIEQAQPGDPGKAVAVYQDFLTPMNDVSIVPG